VPPPYEHQKENAKSNPPPIKTASTALRHTTLLPLMIHLRAAEKKRKRKRKRKNTKTKTKR
jgi:hypothetical protein